MRDARPGGYMGLMVTHGLGWALLNLVGEWIEPAEPVAAGVELLLRLAQAMTVGAEVLGDHQVLANLWLFFPLRDVVAMGVWAAGFAVIRLCGGERFVLKDGKLEKQ